MPRVNPDRLMQLLVRMESDVYDIALLSRNNEISARLEAVRGLLERMITSLQTLCNYDAISIASDTASATDKVFEV